ncbi:MAG: tetratricopeptide repeat protein [Planctomycetota bacterium]
MKKPRNTANVTTIVLLPFGLLICTAFMAVTLLTSVAEAKPASVLLQEGLYAEEIEGNLDAAIKIYEQVIAEAKAAEQTAAQATYRIGMCHLKKGQKAQAAEHFQSIVSKFPQQDSLVAKAQEHLAKLKPPVAAKGLSFGPERLVKLYDIDHPSTKDKERLIDLDEGRLSRVPDVFEGMDDRRRMQWMAEDGIDAVAEISAHDRGLVGFGMATRMMPPHVWDEMGPLEVQVEMAQTQSAREGTVPMFFEGRKYKPVFLFRTRESGLGILQILDADDEQQHVEFRYKMVEADARFAVALARSRELAQRVEQGTKLSTLGKALLIYANDDELNRYPDTLRDLEEGGYLDQRTLVWALENVEYLGEGKTPADHPQIVLGYDKNLLQTGEGTNVFFNDGHIEFAQPDKLEELGIGPPAGAYVFGPVIERIMSDESEDERFLIDFDTGRLHSMPDRFYDAQPVQILPWARNQGIDASLEDSLPGFETDGLTAVRLDEEDWTNMTAVGLEGLLANRRAHIESVEEDGFPSVRLIAEKPGACFGFRTREGGVGILQIADIMQDPWRVKIRYKMLREEPTELGRGEAGRGGAKSRPEAEAESTTGSQFTAALPNGVTVELVGICEHPSQGKQWWRPDGGLLKDSPYDDDFGRAFPKDGENGYKFAVKFAGMAGKEVDVRIRPTNSKSTNGGALFSTSEKNGRENTAYVEGVLDEKIVWLGAAFDQELSFCDIQIGVYQGKWKTQYRYETDQPDDAVEWVEFKNVLLRPGAETNPEFGSIVNSFTHLRGPKSGQKLAGESLAADGWRLWAQGRHIAAERVFKQAVEKDPNNVSALKGLATRYMEHQDYAEAIKYYKMWLKIEPDSADAKAGLERLGIRPTASDYGLGPGEARPPCTRELFVDIRPDRSVNYKTTIRDRNESDAPTTTSVFCTDHIYLTAMYDHKDRPIEFTMDRSGQNFRYHVTLNEPVMPGEMIVYWGEGTKRDMVGRRGDGTLHYHTWYCPRASQPVLRIETYLLPEGAELVPPTWSNIQRQDKNGRIELRLERIVAGDRRITTMFNYRLPGSEQISEADKEADGVGR